MEVYGGAPVAPAAAADELMPPELYHQGGMRIKTHNYTGLQGAERVIPADTELLRANIYDCL